MTIIDKLNRVEYLLKHMPGRHPQQRHAGTRGSEGPLMQSLSDTDKEYLLGGASKSLEVGIYILDDGSKKFVAGSEDVLDAHIDVPDNTTEGVHTHRPDSSKLDTGHPELSASDYRTALNRAMDTGSYTTTAVLPDSGKYTTMQIKYDPGNFDHKELGNLFMDLTAPMGGMVGIAKHAPEVLVQDGVDIGLWEFEYGVLD